MKLKIIDASWHRNGIAGEGFYAILFDDQKNGRMIASLFDEPGYCAVYSVEQLALGNIAFAEGNSWRGDNYADELRPLLEKWLKENGSERVGPFAIPKKGFQMESGYISHGRSVKKVVTKRLIKDSEKSS